MKTLFTALLCSCSIVASAQLANNDVYELGSDVKKTSVRREVRFPKVDGMHPMKCDLHTHTVFSDGNVWPSIRVDEAWESGLDAVAITDHIEYRPFKEIVLGDLNKSNEMATSHAKNKGIIIIKGTEITRRKPLGHLNALFIEDANVMKVDDELEAIDKAIEQGAFILWNHPAYPDKKSTLYPVHEKLIKENKIHGIEVFNMSEYYPVAMDWCNEFNLSYTSNSDIHGLISSTYGEAIRPMTIVYAEERSLDGIKKGMFAKRTLAYFAGRLAADEELLKKVVRSSLETTYENGSTVEVRNNSDVTYTLKNDKSTIHLYAGQTVRFKKSEGMFKITNCFVGMNKNLEMTMDEMF